MKLELRYILCNVCFFRDWKLIVQKEQNKSARALPESGVNTTHAQENGQRLPVHKGDGAQGSLVYDDPVATNDHGASNGNCYYGKLIWWGTCSEERIFLDLPDIWLVLILFSYFANYLQVFSSHCMWSWDWVKFSCTFSRGEYGMGIGDVVPTLHSDKLMPMEYVVELHVDTLYENIFPTDQWWLKPKQCIMCRPGLSHWVGGGVLSQVEICQAT